MAELKSIEKNYIEDFLEMGGGYVLDFSNAQFERFIFDSINLEVYEGKGYEIYSSKANKIRQILKQEPNSKVAQLLQDFLEYKEYRDLKKAEFSEEEISVLEKKSRQEVEKIIQRLKNNNLNEVQSSFNTTKKYSDSSKSENHVASNIVDMSMQYDVFISHASEDKNYVEPLKNALQTAGIKTWYDADQIGWGESIRQSIDRGLINSRFCIVVLSPDFFKKHWAGTYELNAIFQRVAQEQNTLILPIWHNITLKQISQYNLTLPDLKALNSSTDTLEQIVSAMKSKLSL